MGERAAGSSVSAFSSAGTGGLGQRVIPFREVNHPRHKEAYLTLGSRAFNSEETRLSFNNKSFKKNLK